MSVKLCQITYNADTGDGMPTALDDARLYDHLGGGTGIVQGCAITAAGGTQIAVTAGWGIVQGRMFVIDAETITAALATSGTVRGRLYLKIDLGNTEHPAQLLTVAGLPALTQEDLNGGGTVYELALAEYDATQIAITNLATVYAANRGNRGYSQYKATVGYNGGWVEFPGGGYYKDNIPITERTPGAPAVSPTTRCIGPFYVPALTPTADRAQGIACSRVTSISPGATPDTVCVLVYALPTSDFQLGFIGVEGGMNYA